jgi:hypothetical protein
VSQRLFLYVAGRLGSNGDAEFEPFEIINTPEEIASKTQGGSYSLLLEAKDGGVLSEYRFDPPTNYEPDQKASTRFSMFIPYLSMTARIVLRRGNQQLAERVVTPNRPEIKLMPIKAEEVWTGKHVFSWEARDDDGDPLSFSAYYSVDGGNRWIPLDAGFKEPRLEVNFDNLPGSDDGRIRIVASDGVNTTEARPDVSFRVPRKKPQVAISSPVRAADSQQNPAALIEATAYDAEDGAITNDTAYRWSSDRDGFIGTGTWVALSNLSAGKHTLTLTVTDADKNTVRSLVSVTVAEKSRRFDKESAPLPNPDVDAPRGKRPGNANVGEVIAPFDRSAVEGAPGNPVYSGAPAVRGNLGEAVDSLRSAYRVAAGGGHTLALRRDGAVLAWGHNTSGQAGDGTSADRATPAQVSGLGEVRALAAEALHRDEAGATPRDCWVNADSDAFDEVRMSTISSLTPPGSVAFDDNVDCE